jgi:sugar phosphate permease
MNEPMGDSESRRQGRLFYGWWVLAMASVQGLFGGGTAHSGFSVFFLPIQRDLNLNYASMSLVFSLARAEGGVGGFIIGWLVDKLGARPLILVGGLTTGIGMILLSQVHSYWQLLLLYVGVVSIGRSAGMGQTLMATVNQWFIQRKALAMSTLITSFAAGGAIAVPLLALGNKHLGWRETLLYTGIFTCLLTLLVSRFIRSKPEDLGLQPDGGPGTRHVGALTLAQRRSRLAALRRRPPHAPSSEGRTQRSDIPQDFTVRQALHTRAFWLLLLAIFMRVVVMDALMVHQIPMLVWKGVTEQMAAFYIGLMFFLSIPLRFGLGLAGGVVSPHRVVFVGMGIGVLGLLGMLMLHGTPAVLSLMVALAVVESTSSVNWITVGNYFGRSHFASLMGLMSGFLNLGSAIAPVLSGWVFDQTQSYALVLMTGAPLFLLGGILFSLARRPSQ